MFGRKKEAPKETRRGRTDGLSKYGLLDIPGIDNSDFDMNNDDDDDDSALEAELLALTSGSTPVRPRKKPVPVPTENLDALVAESLRDIPSDEEGSVDENDPTLLNELSELVDDDDDDDDDEPCVNDSSSPKQSKTELKPSENSLLGILQERLKMYENAEKNAKASGETSRARRFSRGIKTLNDMIKQANAGRVVNEEDIPPPVLVSATKKPATPPETPSAPEADTNVPLVPSRIAPPPPPVTTAEEMNSLEPVNPIPDPVPDYIAPIGDSDPEPTETESVSVDPTVMQLLLSRQQEYKLAALHAKKEHNNEKALQYVRIVKQFEPVIAAASTGRPVDLNSIPPSPGEVNASQPTHVGSPKTESEHQKSGDDPMKSVGEAAEMMAAAAEAAEGEEPSDEQLFDAPPTPTSVLEALEQRLAKYKSTEQAAKEEGNNSKVRRMGRIVKQYESAIKMHKAGKPIPVDELPTPPGFGPIPVEGAGPAAAMVPKQLPVSPAPEKQVPVVPVTPSQPAVTEPSAEGTTNITPKANIRKSPQSRQEKQLSLLLVRQKKFKEAAIEAKKKGEINQAKEYLRLAKGFDPLIEASQSGLPVDLASVPVPPENKKELETDFDIVTLEDCIPGSDDEIYEKLEQDLLRQTKMCLTTRDHFKATGDIASANRFEQLAVHSKKDLDSVKCAHRRNDPVPKFHYETRSFNIVQCCTELGDNDLELSIIQGINYNVPNPKDVDTYVKFEFPYPTETPVKDRTGLIKDTNNPQYNQTFMLAIQRNVRACQRIFKRHAIKLEVWSRGSIWHRLCCFICLSGCRTDNTHRSEQSSGFFRGDSLIGTATVKLMPLETKCVLHDAFDLMDGRRAVGGKIEVKVRIRNPILTKQVEQVQEKWLVIDQYM